MPDTWIETSLTGHRLYNNQGQIGSVVKQKDGSFIGFYDDVEEQVWRGLPAASTLEKAKAAVEKAAGGGA